MGLAPGPATPSRIIALSEGAPPVVDGTWPDRVLSHVSRCEMHAFEVADPRARVLICAGGGYLRLMYDTEGTDIALWLNGLGYDAYVLVHRLPGADNGAGGAWPSDIALTDGLAALDHLGGDLPVILTGLSSGGHLAGVLACQDRPGLQGIIIAYAPVNANHKDYKAPAGKPDFPPPQKQAFYNDWPIGIAAEPRGLPKCPVFLAYALKDPIVPVEHALNFIKSARDVGLDLDAHIFADAPHGFCLRETEGTQSAWPRLAAEWIARQISA